MLSLKSGFVFLVSVAILALSAPIVERADSSLVGYLFVHFYDREPSIFLHLSNGNNEGSFRTLNNDAAILKPTVGTRGARDPHLVSSPDNARHYIIATDLDISAIGNNWGQAVTHGSRGIIVWESTDLVNWGSERLVTVANSSAGMVWAPEAIWDSNKGQYLVHWSSRYYANSDTNHTGTAGLDTIMYAYTSDFKTFTKEQVYFASSSAPLIDMTLLPLGGSSYARFWKDESLLRVAEERSTNGIFGPWSRVPNANTWVADVVEEGPLAFLDNAVAGKVHLFLDEYTTAKGYVPLETSDINGGVFTASSTINFPKLLKHGVVKPLTQAQYDTISAKYP
ncbi:arabinosidase [Amylostereum chailletii]|nr:arabinosidase [Amylostereum chailletii]